MTPERLAQIEAQWTPNIGPPLNGRQTVLELVGEVRRLRDGITELADHVVGYNEYGEIEGLIDAALKVHALLALRESKG